MSIQFTIHMAPVIYQFMSSLCYLNMHLLRFISFYCTLLYNKYVILLCYIFDHQKNLLISQIITTNFAYFENIESIPFCHFQRPFFAADNLIFHLSKSSISHMQQTLKHAHTEKTLKYGALLVAGQLWLGRL